MTNPIAVSQRARELFILLIGLDATDDFGSIRNGAYDHWKKMQAVARFEAEIRADEREKPARMKAAEIESAIATAIRNQKDHYHE
ncbi:MAG: hypothetical protein A2095_04180 [Sphingomonadales bacterium GWF1_63_6]|nr:MAG: hypothetical protein A2095_04180 [Sphingomonadales bacterium GWF1_63_6]